MLYTPRYIVQGNVGATGTGTSTAAPKQIIRSWIVADVGNLRYTGTSLVAGALTADPVWRIRQFDLTTGLLHLVGSDTFTEIWDNYATLTYI